MTQNPTVTRDEVFDLLSNRRRRFALHVCKQRDAPVELGELAEQIAAWERRKSPNEITYDERRSVYSALQQTHLPAMEDAGVVDPDRSGVELTDAAEELDIYLDIVPENSIPWAEYYLGLSIVCALFAGGVVAGVYPVPGPTAGWIALVALAFLASSVYHVWWNRYMKVGGGPTPPELTE